MRSMRLISSMLVLLASLLMLTGSVGAAQDSASPVAVDGPDDLNLPGIDSQLLGTGTSTTSLSVMPRMMLERIDLPAGSALPPHTASGPELLVTETGTPAITDSFGFTGQIASTGTFFETGAQYSLSNPGTEAALALRLSVAPGTDAALASPVAGEATVAVLIDSPLDDPRLSEPTLSIAKLTWYPDTEPQVLDHDAAIGLVVLDGTLFAKSPSGFEGQLAPNTPVVFPAITPLEARASEDGPASALVVSITDGATPIVSAPEPTPTPIPTATPTLTPSITPTPTKTLVPTETPIPTETLIPTKTLVPTETPTPLPSSTPTSSPTPLPTVNPNTPPGTVLQNHKSWRQGDGRLTADISIDWVYILVDFTYTNMGTSRQDFVVSPGLLTVNDDNHNSFEVNGDDAQRVIIEPGKDFKYRLQFRSSQMDGNVFIYISEFGDARDASWGFTISQGEIVPMADDAAQLSQSSSTAQSGSPAPSQSDNSSLGQTVAAALPASIVSLSLSEQGTRGQSEITSTFPNPGEADALFTQWGWSGSNYEVFVAPNGVAGPDGLYEVDIGIHYLAGPAEAVEALTYFMDARVNLLGLWAASVDPLGTMSKALVGPSGDGGYEASVYVVVGSQVVRVTALSWNGYPLESAISITRQVIGA